MQKQVTQSVKKVFNFGPGPGALPIEILKKAQEEFLNFQGSGMSIMEITNLDQEVGTHPGVSGNNPLQAMMLNTEQKLRDLLKIPQNYRVLFQHGGAVGQFSAIPMNLCENLTDKADYVRSGFWSKRCSIEAQKYCDVHIPIEFKDTLNIPVKDWNIRKDAKYVHFCSNETIQGLEFHEDPQWSSDLPPLICDATSTILSRPIDISQFGLIYASGGKNIPAGMCLVIIKEDLLKTKQNPLTPQILDYRASGGGLMPKSSVFESRPNTPPVFPVYLLGLMCEHLLEKFQGLENVQKSMHARAKKVYDVIDNCKGFYNCTIDKNYRSVMNAVFRIGDEKNLDLEKLFYKEAEEQNMLFLFGFESKDPNSVGLSPLHVRGVRVTMYIGVSDEAVDAIAEFLQSFYNKYKDQI